jgi:phosphate transport system permease protein
MVRLDPHVTQRLVKSILWAFTGFTLLILVFIIVDISVKGLPQVTPGFLLENPTDMGRAGGIFATIVATAYITALAILVASPLGVGTAIYLTEYTREGWTTRIIRFGAECLAGVPSIILGLFGFVLFVLKLGFGWSVLSGALSLAIMVLPSSSAPARRLSRPYPVITARPVIPWG